MKEKLVKLYFNIGEYLQSFIITPLLLAIGLLCWFLGWYAFGVYVLAITFSLILIFCKDIKNIFCPLFFAAFFIPDIFSGMHYTAFIAPIVIAMSTLAISSVVRVIAFRKTLKLGKLFIGLIISFVAYLLGGVIDKFNIITSLTILGFCAATLVFYFLTVNFTKDFGEYIKKLLTLGGIPVAIQIVYNYFARGGASFYCAIGLNTAALYVVISIVGLFFMAYQSKKDYLYFIAILVLTVAVVLSKCRMAMLLTAPLDILLTVILLKKTQNKWTLFAIIGGVIAAFTVTLLVSQTARDKIYELFFGKFNRGEVEDLSGRRVLWAFCIDRFLEYPVFGYGFYYEGPIVSLRANSYLILAHNTPLQWLTCTGVVGTLLMVVFYVNKYLILFKDFNKQNWCNILCILVIALSGFLDQAATMDPFLPIVAVALIAAVECANRERGVNPLKPSAN